MPIERERQREMLEAWDNMWTDCVLHLLLLLPAAAALLDSLSHGGKKKKRREKGRSHHMVDEAGTTGPSTLFYFFFFFILSRYCCYEFPKERRKKREKILMWDNPHVSHESPATCVVVVVAIDRPTTATHHLKNVAHSEHDKRRHRLSGNAVVHDCQQTSTFTFFLLLLLLLLQYKKKRYNVCIISDHSSLRPSLETGTKRHERWKEVRRRTYPGIPYKSYNRRQLLNHCDAMCVCNIWCI